MINKNTIQEYYSSVSEYLTYEDFLMKIENKKKLLGDLCDEEMCIQLVLNDLSMIQKKDVEYTNNESASNKKSKEIYDNNFVSSQFKTVSEIKNLESNQLVFLKGIVSSIYNLKEFKRKDGTIGRLICLMISDNTGRIKVNLWNENTSIITEENIKLNSVVNISGYYKKIENGSEININNGCFIGISNENIDFSTHKIKIKEISEYLDKNIEIECKILNISDIRNYVRKDNKQGQLQKLTVGDETGTIKLNLWDKQIDINSNLKVEDSIKLINVYIKKNKYFNNFELSISNSEKIEKLDYDIYCDKEYTKIGNIKNLDKNLNVIGKIIDISEIRTFIKKDGSEGAVGNITIGDETGKIKITIWNENITLLDNYNFNETIEVINCFSKINEYNKQIELYLNSDSLIRKYDQENIEYIEKKTMISDISIVGHLYNISGIVTDIKDKIIILEDESNNKINIHYNKYPPSIIDQIKVGDKININNILAIYDNDNTLCLSLIYDSIIS